MKLIQFLSELESMTTELIEDFDNLSNSEGAVCKIYKIKNKSVWVGTQFFKNKDSVDFIRIDASQEYFPFTNIMNEAQSSVNFKKALKLIK